MSTAPQLSNRSLYPSAELIHGLQPRPDRISPTRHAEIVRRVIESYRAAKHDQARAPAAYRPAGAWADHIAQLSSLFDAMLSDNTSLVSERLKRFRRNEIGALLTEHARFDQLVAREPEAVERFETRVRRNVAIWRALHEHDSRVLDMAEVGEPWGLILDGRLVTPKAPRYHAVASQIGELNRGLARPLVVEWGGGAGDQAYFLLRDWPGTVYVDFDLPETLAIAAYHLLAALPDHEIVLYGETHRPLDEVLTEADAVLLPNHALPKLADRVADVFLASFSLGEVPYGSLQEILPQIQRGLRRFLLIHDLDRAANSPRTTERTSIDRLPLHHAELRCLYRKFDLFLGPMSEGREYLFEKL